MTDITIAAGGFPHAHNLTAGEIWVIANKSYTTPDGKMLTASTPAEGIFVARAPFTIDGSNVMQVPEIVIDATEDSIDHPDATLGAYIMTTQGRPVSVLSVFRAFGAPASPTSTSWPALAAHNAGTLPADVGHDVVITGDLDVSGVTTLAHLALALGSDANGDMYMRSGGEIVRIPVGDEDSILTVVEGLPAWQAPPSSLALSEKAAANWSFDEGGGVNFIDSVAGLALVPSGNYVAAGKVGSAFYGFNGENRYATMADAPAVSIQAGEDLYVAFWYNLEVPVAEGGVVSKWGGTQDEWLFYCQTTVLRFGLKVGATVFEVAAPIPTTAGTWYFVEGWYDHTAQTVNIRLNRGTTVSAAVVGTPNNSNSPFEIMRFGTEYASSNIDELSIFKVVLSDSESEQLYNLGAGIAYPYVEVVPVAGRAYIVNVVDDYHASGNGDATTASRGVSSGATSLTLTADIAFEENQGILIAGAGASGADYIGRVTGVSGLTVSFTPATSTGVSSGALVQHDDTVAIQNAINAVVAALGGDIFFPIGTYRVNGPVQGTTNSSLYLPTVGNAAGVVPVRLWSNASTVASAHGGTGGGTLILSDRVVGSGSHPAIFAASAWSDTTSGWNTGGFNQVLPIIERINWRVKPNPTLSCINFHNCGNAILKEVNIDTGKDLATIVQPTTTDSHALILPGVNNHLNIRCEGVTALGFYNGIRFSEHAHFIDCNVYYCHYALVREKGIHLSQGSVSMEGVQTFLYQEDVGRNRFIFTLERYNLGDWKSHVANRDLYDPTNQGTGLIEYSFTDSGSPTSANLEKTGFSGTEMFNLHTGSRTRS